MALAIKNLFSRLKPSNAKVASAFKNMKISERELADIQAFDTLQPVAKCLSFSLPHVDSSSITKVVSKSSEIKQILSDTEDAVYTVLKANEEVNRTVLQSNIGEFELKSNAQYFVRSIFFNIYLEKLKKLVQNNEVSLQKLGEIDFTKLIDSFMKGDFTDRLNVHIRLYGEKLTPWQLQNCYYSLLESELQTLTSFWLKERDNIGLHFKSEYVLSKGHDKDFTKFSATYLLDKLEVNVKSRCVFAWADPQYKGFRVLDENEVMGVDEIMVAHKQYFAESNKFGKTFLDDYIAKRRQYYADKLDFRKKVKYSIAFFFGICVLDYAVTVM